ncbi:3-hydroxyacyl-CoA dehydrogenase family protein [Chloroflexota bacterium]
MKLEEVKKTTVIGAGMMGSQIAEILSRIGGYEVNIVDMNSDLVSKGLEAIEGRLERFFVAKGKLTAEEKQRIMGRIKGSTSANEAVKDVDFAIEAAVENLAIKREIFKKLDESAPPRTILASNTSNQNISDIASATNRPEQVVGVHFFNPVGAMKLVEVVRGARTSDETVELARELASKLGKEPVVCRDASYGFLANRAYAAMANEAVQMLWERVAPPEEIDKALKLGYNLPMGPLELMDFVGGWPLWVSSEQDAMRELGPEKGRLHPLLRAMARAGYAKIYDFWNDVLSKW